MGGIFKILKNALDFPHANKSSRGQSGENFRLSWDFDVQFRRGTGAGGALGSGTGKRREFFRLNFVPDSKNRRR